MDTLKVTAEYRLSQWMKVIANVNKIVDHVMKKK